uniref:Uncharacterized protein n=1 Tax=Salix viminalis TaxID=40686 RepID=A0A6N2MED2_SALVM
MNNTTCKHNIYLCFIRPKRFFIN